MKLFGNFCCDNSKVQVKTDDGMCLRKHLYEQNFNKGSTDSLSAEKQIFKFINPCRTPVMLLVILAGLKGITDIGGIIVFYRKNKKVLHSLLPELSSLDSKLFQDNLSASVKYLDPKLILSVMRDISNCPYFRKAADPELNTAQPDECKCTYISKEGDPVSFFGSFVLFPNSRAGIKFMRSSCRNGGALLMLRSPDRKRNEMCNRADQLFADTNRLFFEQSFRKVKNSVQGCISVTDFSGDQDNLVKLPKYIQLRLKSLVRISLLGKDHTFSEMYALSTEPPSQKLAGDLMLAETGEMLNNSLLYTHNAIKHTSAGFFGKDLSDSFYESFRLLEKIIKGFLRTTDKISAEERKVYLSDFRNIPVQSMLRLIAGCAEEGYFAADK